MSFSDDTKRFFKGTLIGAAISAALCAVLMCITALIVNMISGMPYSILSYVAIGSQAISVLIGSYIAAAISKSKGLLVGLISSGVILVITLIIGFCSTDGQLSFLTLIRIVLLLLMGALGGIKGVNRKERVRIR